MSAQFLIVAALQTALFVWLVQTYRRTGAIAALIMLLPQLFLVYDNLIVGIGSAIGLGDLLYFLSWPRFWAHWLSGYWLIAACGFILRDAGVRWAQGPWLVGGCLALVAGITAMELPNFWTVDLFPICQADLVRYTTTITPGQSCTDPAFSIEQRDNPLAVIIANFVAIISGGILLHARRFPWLLIGSASMLLTAAIPALREIKADCIGEALISAGVIWSISKFCERPKAVPRPGPLRTHSA